MSVKMMSIFSSCYILVFLLNYYNGERKILLSQAIDINGIEQIYIIPYAIGGSILVIALGKIIKANKILEWFGRNSLMLYILHAPIIRLLMIWSREFLVKNELYLSFSLVVIYYVVVFLFVWLLSLLTSTKYGSYLMGKF